MWRGELAEGAAHHQNDQLGARGYEPAHPLAMQYLVSTASLVEAIMVRPYAVTEEEMARHGNWPTVAPVKPYLHHEENKSTLVGRSCTCREVRFRRCCLAPAPHTELADTLSASWRPFCTAVAEGSVKGTHISADRAAPKAPCHAAGWVELLTCDDKRVGGLGHVLLGALTGGQQLLEDHRQHALLDPADVAHADMEWVWSRRLPAQHKRCSTPCCSSCCVRSATHPARTK